jgi:RNA polymerase sigma-70 factor (ECF subfamily)
MDRCPAGFGPDELLMRALYHDHARPLHAFVLRLVSDDRQLAEDVVQETLLRAWRNASRLDSDNRSLRPWLTTVARRVVVDQHRSSMARPQETGSDVLERMPAPDETERVLLRMTIADALSDLSGEHRKVLLETYFKDRTASEAAAALGLPPGTVRSRVYYALQKMRAALEERGVTS